MVTETTSVTNSDEQLMGAIAHFFGLLAALVIWILQKDKSKYVRFQAVQALAFDVLAMILGIVVSFCIMGMAFLGTAGSVLAAVNSSSPDELAPIFMLPFMFPFGIFACTLPFSLTLFVLRTFAAGSILAGKDFRYPVLGKWVDNFLGEQA